MSTVVRWLSNDYSFVLSELSFATSMIPNSDRFSKKSFETSIISNQDRFGK